MRDLTELVQSAARFPVSLDLAAIERRAHALRRQQRMTRSAMAVAAVAIVVPLALHFSGDDKVRLRQQNPASGGSPTPTPTSTGSTVTPAPSTGPGSGTASSPSPAAAGSAGAAAPGGGSRHSSSGTSTSAPRTGSSAPKPSPPPGYPPAASCHVNGRTVAPGGSKSCKFLATASGGWRMKYDASVFAGGHLTEFEVRVTRNGYTTVWSSSDTPSVDCMNNVIQPGDLVTATLRPPNQGVSTDDIGAGAGYGC